MTHSTRSLAINLFLPSSRSLFFDHSVNLYGHLMILIAVRRQTFWSIEIVSRIGFLVILGTFPHTP